MVPRDLEHSRNRARLRELVLFDVARHKVRTLGEIASATGIRPSRVLGILLGDGKEYAFDLALVPLRTVAMYDGFGATVFTITPEGAAEVDRIVGERRRARRRAPSGAKWDHVAPPGGTWDHVAPPGRVATD